MKNSKKAVRIAATMLAVALTATLCACGQQNTGSNASSERNIVSYDEINKEYKESVAKLDWPDSYSPPVDLEGEDTGMVFQEGYGDTRASMLFECAWEREWLSTYTTDNMKANAAIEQLSKVPEMGFRSPQRCDDATRRYFNDNLTRAKLGDPSGFQETVELNCPDS